MMIRDLINRNRPFRFPVLRGDVYGQSLVDLRNKMNNLFKGFKNTIPAAWTREASLPAVDVIEEGADFKIRAEMPGIDPENVDVSVTDGFLTIKGKKEEEKEKKDVIYLRRETSYGSFNRTLALPATADSEKAEASFKNGILFIQVPKKPGALHQPKKLPVKKVA